MNVKTAISARNTPFVDTIASSYQDTYGASLRPHSVAAIADLESLPFPTSKNEFWKYTRLGKLTKNTFRFTDEGQINPKISPISDAETVLLVFVNGIFEPPLSDQLPE